MDLADLQPDICAKEGSCFNTDPWFVAKDVCDILELKNPTMVVNALDDDERSKFNLGRQGETIIVNKPGLYSLVLRSRKPELQTLDYTMYLINTISHPRNPW